MEDKLNIFYLVSYCIKINKVTIISSCNVREGNMMLDCWDLKAPTHDTDVQK